ncbi:MAG: molybdopterin cofactor-binding domain-containing protein, partial [Pseudomonadota bacterium]
MPFRPTDMSFVAETMRGVAGGVMKLIGMHITGGSTSVPDSFEKLRMAGAVARETLKKAAARTAGVRVRDLTTADGQVRLPDGTSLSYEELAPVAAKIRPVSEMRLRDPAEWRLIGKEMQRIDILAKSTGTQDYGIDHTLEGMLHAAVKRNPRQGGELLSYDEGAASTMRGVRKVVPISGGIGVIADNTWRAFRAAEAVKVDWDPAPYPPEMEGHWQALSDSFDGDFLDKVARDDGDVEAALSKGDILEAEYRVPYVAHAPLEPITATVLVQEKRVDIWTATQVPRFVQMQVEKIVGIRTDDIHVHVLMAGGSFGHRLETGVVEHAAELALAMKGTPIKLTYSREEDMLHDYPRQIAMARGRGVISEGKVETYDLGIAMPSVMGSQMGRVGMSVP